jgi:GH24 family phage-related lysozyme (muramidase)
MMRHSASVLFFTVTAVVALACGCEKAGEDEFPTLEKMTAGIFLDVEERAVLPPDVELRPVYERGIVLTKTSEGFRSRLYNDAAGYCTIAFGHLIKLARCDGTEPPEFLRGVTEEEGTELLVTDMGTAQVVVMTSVDVDLTDGQYAALCDFVFNVGGGNFRRSTLRRVINTGDFDGVPFQFRRWVKAGGRTLPGLVTRREKEVDLYFDGLPTPRAAPREMDLEPIDIRAGERNQ